ncbi:MAG TPA: serine/threonine-protein kinase [Streptosporangiaceae bacterium]|jgi:predicted Ser/Thr protein kinase
MDAHSGGRLGPYLLREQLGEGGMGVVYLASDPDGSLVAVKVLRQGVAAEATARRRLAREVATMRLVHSPFVAEVVDADIEADQPYIVTRYVAGRTLDDVVGEHGPLAGAALASLARGLAAALVAVHAAGVVHRDLKPGNIMLVDGQPVVIDFGIAQALDSTRLTMTGMFMGTPGYLAPEVIEGSTSGPAADVHSWAATVAYAATGKPPFGTGQFETIFYRIVHGQPELDCMPAALLPIVVAALARDPSRRPSAAELADFAAGLKPETLVAAPAGAALNAALVSQATHTAVDGAQQLPAAASPIWPGTRPMGARPQDDFADLLTPVRYSPAPARPGQLIGTPTVPPGSVQPWSAPPGSGLQGSAGRGQLAGGQAPPARPGSAARSPSQAARLPLVLATLAALVAISVLLPIAGAVAALGVLVLLHATDVTTAWLSRRRSRQGPRSSDPVSATAFYPWAVCRSVLSFLLRAPLALLCAAVAAVLAVLAGGQTELPRAGGFAAGALVACYCIGPGSRACRRPLSMFYGRVARSGLAAAIGSLGLAAMVAGVVVAAATSTPGYWPDWHLGNQLQSATFAHPALNHYSGHVTDLGRQLAHWLGRL